MVDTPGKRTASVAASARSPRGWFVMRGALVVTVALGCGGNPTPPRSSPVPASRTVPGSWADSVLATLSPRDRAAQLVWPQLFGDFTPTSSASWRRVSDLITQQH